MNRRLSSEELDFFARKEKKRGPCIDERLGVSFLLVEGRFFILVRGIRNEICQRGESVSTSTSLKIVGPSRS